jgi:hypothetical protein
MDEIATLRPDYRDWLERVRATYEAVGYTCGHRLHDRELGKQVSVAVVAGLVSRPGVFRYQGLPFSGRIATLAEARLVEAREGRLPSIPDWYELWAALTHVPPEVQDAFVLSCVHGLDVSEISANLGCSQDSARSRCADALRMMRSIGDLGDAAADPER